ncbi:hypothetical protein HYS00_00005, partial [Candidatus Microgenomates bacterium]|nr:hypothetical protein [Candidatus Microgenomates bacterium]
MTIKKAFERKEIAVTLILPVRAFGEVQINPQAGPDPQTAAYFLQNADQVKQFAFHSSQPNAPPTKVELAKKKAASKKANKSLPIYLSVFGFLLLVLVLVVVLSRQPPPNKPIATTASAEAPAAAIAPPALVPEASAPAVLDHTALNMQIKVPPLFRTKADEIKGRLIAAGYTTVDIVEGVAGEKTILFLDKSKLSDAQRAALVSEMKTYFTNFSVQEVEQSQYAIQLVAGKEL